jgi:hypothetical protein
MLLVPLAMLVAAAGLEVAGAAGDIQGMRRQTALVEASLGPHGLLNRLEDERNVATITLVGLEDAVVLEVEDNAAARAQTDVAVTRLEAEIERIGGSVAVAYRPALAGLSQLTGLREDVDAYDGPRGLAAIDSSRPFFDRYTDAMDLLFEANRRVVEAIGDPRLRRGAEIIDISTRQTDIIARLVAEMGASLGRSGALREPDRMVSVSMLLHTLQANHAQIELYAVGDYGPPTAKLRAADQVALFPRLVDDALTTGEVHLDELLDAGAGGEAGSSDYVEFREAAAAILRTSAEGQEAAAAGRARRVLASTLGALVLTTVVTWLVARSITRPLVEVAREAEDMASRRLPQSVRSILDTPIEADVDLPLLEPIEVRSRDEVVDLAAALSAVQAVALDLATEQAVLRRNLADTWLNVGRRNQSLLARQIDEITQLEGAERNAENLGALFYLDHLATRMRRNAESLLVLAGVETPRPYGRPVPIGDVVRAAVGEVEDYRRVSSPHLTPVTVAGAAAADVSHLLAELIENALTFSPPGRLVELRGTHVHDRYRLVVIDEGLGMDPETLARANRRLAGQEAFTVAPSRYLGHYVAGQLAARHGVSVSLHQLGGSGLTAIVDLPHAVLELVPQREEATSRPAARQVPAYVLPSGSGGEGRGAHAGASKARNSIFLAPTGRQS